MKLRWSAALGALGCALVAAACGEVPILPQWDADWYVPLPSQSVSFPLSGTLPANTPFAFSDSLGSQDMSGAIGDLLQKDLKGGHVIMTLAKTTQVSMADTLFIGSAPGDTVPSNPATILLPFAMTVSQASVTDTIAITPANITMLSTVANTTNGRLYLTLKVRGSTGPNPVTITSSDTLGIRVALIATIAMSR